MKLIFSKRNLEDRWDDEVGNESHRNPGFALLPGGPGESAVSSVYEECKKTE